MHTPVCCRLPLPLWSSGDEWRTSLKQLHTLTRVCDWRGECVSLFGGGGGGGGRCISGGQTAVISRINRLPSKPWWIPVSTLPWAIMYPVYRCCREGNSRDFTDCETLTKVSNHKHTTNVMKLLWFKNVCRIVVNTLSAEAEHEDVLGSCCPCMRCVQVLKNSSSLRLQEAGLPLAWWKMLAGACRLGVIWSAVSDSLSKGG